MGWLMFKKHPDVLVKGSKIDVEDLRQDPLIRFHAKYYYPLYFLVNLLIPIAISVYYMGATLYSAFLYSYMLRYATALHSTWFVNSAAHMFGDKPYNEKIRPVENIFVSFFTVGEGYHNYHHTFPYDYATSEFSRFNVAKTFIELMAKYGMASNLKRASGNLVSNSRSNVEKRLHKMNKEDDKDNYAIMYRTKDVKMNGHANSQASAIKVCDDLNESIGGRELNEKIEEIKNKQDFNNNIMRNIVKENGELKGR